MITMTMAELQALWDAQREQALREYNENLNDRVSHDWGNHETWRLNPDHVFGAPWSQGPEVGRRLRQQEEADDAVS